MPSPAETTNGPELVPDSVPPVSKVTRQKDAADAEQNKSSSAEKKTNRGTTYSEATPASANINRHASIGTESLQTTRRRKKGGDKAVEEDSSTSEMTSSSLQPPRRRGKGTPPLEEDGSTAASAPGAVRVDGMLAHATSEHQESVMDSLVMMESQEIPSHFVHDSNPDFAKQESNLVVAAALAPDFDDIDSQIKDRVKEEADRIRKEMMQDAVKASVVRFGDNESGFNSSEGKKKRCYYWLAALLIILGVVGAVLGVVLSKGGGGENTETPTPSPITLHPSASPTMTMNPTLAPSMPRREWFKVQSLRDDDGYSIDLSGPGTHLAVGTILGGPTGNGFVRIYEQQTNDEEGDEWRQVGADIISSNIEEQWFGLSVTLSDDGSIVVIASNTAISAFEHKSDDSTWTQTESRNSNGTIAEGEDILYDDRGLALSRDSFYLAAVLSNRDPTTGTADPYVRVFDRTRSWGEAYISPNQRDLFRGASAAISTGKGGTRVAVGDQGTFLSGGRGTVRVLQYSTFDGQWVQLGSTVEGKNEFDYAGEAVALSDDGNILAVGSGQADRGGLGNIGLVTVYRFVDDEWVQFGNEIVGDAAGDALGMTMSMSSDGSRILVGSQFGLGRSEKGYVRAFQYHERDMEWKQLGEDLIGEAPLQEFGFSLGMSAEGNRIAVSAPDQSSDSLAAGYVDIYELQNLVRRRER